ncbi:MAG: CHAT domain-containing protein, partial [Cyanobacteriota bacterium]|nr:CHAT domain-containing protein [Cyanobacteriota bacterium]
SETATPSPLLPPPTPAIETVRSAPPPQPSRRKFWLWALLAAISFGAIAFSGWWFLFGRESSEEQIVDSTQGRTRVQPQETNGANVNRVSTEELTAKAIEQAIQGQIEESAIAIEALLDPQRNALPYARAALDGVPLEQQDEPQILFLRGRLAWQSVLQGNTDFSVDDARRYWESAVKADPNSLLYQNALGFAYYEEGDFARANLAWSDALELGQQQTTNPDEGVLTTYAGLALALRQMAASQRDRSQQMPIDKAIKLRQLVMTQDPAGFQSDALSAHWLWSEKAIDDWQALGAASDSQETE